MKALSVVVEACWLTAHILMDGEQRSRPEARLHPQGMPQGPMSSRCVSCTQESPALALCLPSKTAPHKQCQVLLQAQDVSKCLFTGTELILGKTWLFSRNLVSMLECGRHSPMGPIWVWRLFFFFLVLSVFFYPWRFDGWTLVSRYQWYCPDTAVYGISLNCFSFFNSYHVFCTYFVYLSIAFNHKMHIFYVLCSILCSGASM